MTFPSGQSQDCAYLVLTAWCVQNMGPSSRNAFVLGACPRILHVNSACGFASSGPLPRTTQIALGRTKEELCTVNLRNPGSRGRVSSLELYQRAADVFLRLAQISPFRTKGGREIIFQCLLQGWVSGKYNVKLASSPP